MQRWTGKTALVTGASSGIGRAIAVELLNHGVNVVACARRVNLLETLKDEIDTSKPGDLMTVKCDLAKEEEILDMFKRIEDSEFKGVDICVNNAGQAFEETALNGKAENDKCTLDLNVLALNICTREAVKSMRSRGKDVGHIINISSQYAHYIVPELTMYCASKHAAKALTDCVRKTLLKEKSLIRVTGISPGVVKTPMFLTLGEEGFKKFMSENFHMLPRDIASAVIYVLSVPQYIQVHELTLYPIGMPDEA